MTRAWVNQTSTPNARWNQPPNRQRARKIAGAASPWFLRELPVSAHQIRQLLIKPPPDPRKETHLRHPAADPPRRSSCTTTVDHAAHIGLQPRPVEVEAGRSWPGGESGRWRRGGVVGVDGGGMEPGWPLLTARRKGEGFGAAQLAQQDPVGPQT